MLVYYPTKIKRERGDTTTLYEVLYFDEEAKIRDLQAATKADRLGFSLIDRLQKEHPKDFFEGLIQFKFEPPLDMTIFYDYHEKPEPNHQIKWNDYLPLSKKEKKEFLNAVKGALANWNHQP
jgi:hypothetical protein